MSILPPLSLLNRPDVQVPDHRAAEVHCIVCVHPPAVLHGDQLCAVLRDPVGLLCRGERVLCFCFWLCAWKKNTLGILISPLVQEHLLHSMYSLYMKDVSVSIDIFANFILVNVYVLFLSDGPLHFSSCTLGS